MSTENFYTSLPALPRFMDLTDPQNYVPVPPDWYVLITDIVESTGQIEAGRYKDVNLLGASSIIAVLNQVGSIQVPFVFGGDGASLVVPPSLLARSRDALLALRQRARVAFQLDLRVGIVPVEIVTQARPLMVSKLQVAPKYTQASFLGGGLTYASDLVKINPAYQLQVNQFDRNADLSGLECRWQDIPSRYGDMVSLVVTSLASQQKSHATIYTIYQEVLKAVESIYGHPRDYHPLTASTLKLSFNAHKLAAEMKAKAKSLSFQDQGIYLLKMLAENALGWCFIRFKLKVGNTNWGLYKQEVIAASDYQKIDDLLRMVIASQPSQTRQLQQYLEQQFQAETLAYGLHVSDRALMTCLIFENRDRHLHLIDGADGGYALAAKELKQRLQLNTEV